MCTVVKANVVVALLLRNKRCVCGERLRKKRDELLCSDSGLLADVSFASIRSLVDIHRSAMSLRFRHGTYGVCKKAEAVKDKLFNAEFQNRYCEIMYSPKECEVIKSVLIPKE